MLELMQVVGYISIREKLRPWVAIANKLRNFIAVCYTCVTINIVTINYIH